MSKYKTLKELDLYRRAKAGNAEAQFVLSVLLNGNDEFTPECVRQSGQNPLKWLKRAAKGGFAEAQFQFAYTALNKTPDMPEMYIEAAKWLTKAQKAGHPDAIDSIQESIMPYVKDMAPEILAQVMDALRPVLKSIPAPQKAATAEGG